MSDLPPGTQRSWEHEFRTTSFRGSTFFEHRDADLWLEDMLTVAGFTRGDDYDEASVRPLDDDTLIITVAGTERVLRFVCVLLNQHAEQSPGDATPLADANRLDMTLAGPAREDRP